MLNGFHHGFWSRLLLLTVPALLSLGLTGCATFWEKVTSRNFKFKDLYSTPDPYQVLLNSSDGDERAQALRTLREPKQLGRSDKEQDMVVEVLVLSAKSDPQPLCRLAAIDALGHFKDPRAAQGLIDAFWAVDAKPAPTAPKKKALLTRMEVLQAANKAIPPDTASIIQCEALRALGETRNPMAVELLTLMARPEPHTPADTSERDREQVRDLKLAAVRALGNFKHYQATETLVFVLKNEKDVALRNRAVDSLEEATGKSFGDDPKAWEGFLHQSPTATAQGEGDWKVKLAGWFSPSK